MASPAGCQHYQRSCLLKVSSLCRPHLCVLLSPIVNSGSEVQRGSIRKPLTPARSVAPRAKLTAEHLAESLVVVALVALDFEELLAGCLQRVRSVDHSRTLPCHRILKRHFIRAFAVCPLPMIAGVAVTPVLF